MPSPGMSATVEAGRAIRKVLCRRYSSVPPGAYALPGSHKRKPRRHDDHDGHDHTSIGNDFVVSSWSLLEPQAHVEPERRRAGIRKAVGGCPEVGGETPVHTFDRRFGEGIERHETGCRTRRGPRLHAVVDLANIAAAAVVEDGPAASTQL